MSCEMFNWWLAALPLMDKECSVTYFLALLRERPSHHRHRCDAAVHSPHWRLRLSHAATIPDCSPRRLLQQRRRLSGACDTRRFLLLHFSVAVSRSVSSVAGDRGRRWAQRWLEPGMDTLPEVGRWWTEGWGPHLQLSGVVSPLPWRTGQARGSVPEREGCHQTAHRHAQPQAAPALGHPPGAKGEADSQAWV